MVVGARHRILRGVCRARHANYERESMIRAPLLRSRPSIPRVSGIAERWDCVRQIYGLTATRLAEPVRCVTEEDQNPRRAVNRFSRRPGVRGPVRLARQNS